MEESAKAYDNSFLLQLCNSFKYETFNKGEVVFEQNEASNNKLYVILNGKVIIQKKEEIDKIIAYREHKSYQEISLASPANSPKTKKNKLSKIPESAFLQPINKKLDSFEKIQLLEIDEKDDDSNIDGEIFIDNKHSEIPERGFGRKKESVFLSSFGKKTPSYQGIESNSNNMMIMSQMNFDRRPKLSEEEDVLARWSAKLSNHFGKILKRPMKIMKSEIISPYVLENFVNTYGNIIRIMEKGEAIGIKKYICFKKIYTIKGKKH